MGARSGYREKITHSKKTYKNRFTRRSAPEFKNGSTIGIYRVLLKILPWPLLDGPTYFSCSADSRIILEGPFRIGVLQSTHRHHILKSPVILMSTLMIRYALLYGRRRPFRAAKEENPGHGASTLFLRK